MSSSNSNLPAIILVVIAILILGGFYYLDRSSSSTDISAITDTADTDGMIESKKKYEAHKSAFAHSGFSGSIKDYLAHVKSSTAMSSKDLKDYSSYSGKNYVEQHNEKEVSAAKANTSNHMGFSGSMKDYAAGDYKKHSVPCSQQETC